MYYAVTFDKGLSTAINTWTDWHMVPSSRPVISPPRAKKTIIDIPGSNNRIDLTETLSGDVTYENRTGSIEFIVMNEKPMTWYELYNTILNTIHGRRVGFSLEEEPDWYYEGRVEVNEWKSDPDFSRIVIEYDVDPFKYKKLPTTETFSVSSGVTARKTYRNSRMPVIPKITASASGMTVKFKGTTYNLAQGEQVVAGIIFEGNSNNQLEFTGNGNITVTYQEGKL